MDDASTRDLAARRKTLFLIWILPMALLFGLNFAQGVLDPKVIMFLVAALLAWMGSACTLNAFRCRRIHCIISGPVLLIAAAMLVLIALEMLDLGRDGPNYVIWGAFALVGLSFVPEMTHMKYLGQKS